MRVLGKPAPDGREIDAENCVDQAEQQGVQGSPKIRAAAENVARRYLFGPEMMIQGIDGGAIPAGPAMFHGHKENKPENQTETGDSQNDDGSLPFGHGVIYSINHLKINAKKLYNNSDFRAQLELPKYFSS